MKILVIGAGGMIGHKMFQILKKQGHQVFATIRQKKSFYKKFNLFGEHEVFDLVEKC